MKMISVSKRTGIKLYVNEATDGKSLELSRSESEHQKWFKERRPELRLKEANRTNYFTFEGSPTSVVLVATGALVEKMTKVKQKAKVNVGDREKKEKEQKQRAEAREKAIYLFAWEIGAAAFIPLFAGLTNEKFLIAFIDEAMNTPGEYPKGVSVIADKKKLEKMPAAARLREIRRDMAFHFIFNLISWGEITQLTRQAGAVQAFAKKLQPYANQWGLILPKDLVNQAKHHDFGIDKAA